MIWTAADAWAARFLQVRRVGRNRRRPRRTADRSGTGQVSTRSAGPDRRRQDRFGRPVRPMADQPRRVDWSGFTVLPGLIDLHTHIADGAVVQGSDPAEPLKQSEAATILKAVPAAGRCSGRFTTVRDVGVYRGLTDVALRDAINAGEVEGPRMFVAGGYITTPGGGGAIDALAPDIPLPETFRIGEVRNAGEARDRARYLLDHGADFIKLIATGAVLALGSEPGALELQPGGNEGGVRRGEAARELLHRPRPWRGGNQGGDPRRRPDDRACELSRRGGHRARQGTRRVARHGHLQRRLDRRGGHKAGLAGRISPQEPRDDGHPAARICGGGEGGREADVRHRCGRLPLRPRRPADSYMVALRNDAAAGHPVGDERSGASARARKGNWARFDPARGAT